MSKYIYQSPKECSRALQLIMEQTDKEEIAKSFIEDVEAVKDLLPMAESEDTE